MISWIKYSPIKLRESATDATKAAGATFRDNQRRELNIGGNIVQYSAPRSSLFGKTSETFDTGSRDALLFDDFKIEHPGLVATENWLKTVILLKEWTYNGAWFSGRKARTHFAVTLHKRAPKKGFPGDGFLNSRSFEFAIANLLDNYYSHRLSNSIEKTPTYNGPQDWHRVKQAGRAAVTFKLYNPAAPLRLFIFPVTQDILAIFEFAYYGENALQGIQDELPKKIIDSVRVIPSEEVRIQLEELEKTDGYKPQLSETMEPFNWPISIEDVRRADEQACSGVNVAPHIEPKAQEKLM